MGLSVFGTSPAIQNINFKNWNDFESQSQQSKYISQILQSHSNKDVKEKKLRVVYF
jgi:hypothetical protein